MIPEVVADPKRPYKAIAGAIVTFLGLLWANIQASPHPLNSVNDWLSVLIPTAVAFGAVYKVTNPKVVK